MNLAAVGEFLAKSGMRKIGAGLYLFTGLTALTWAGVLPSAEYVEVVRWLILAIFGGNVLEHKLKTPSTQPVP